MPRQVSTRHPWLQLQNVWSDWHQYRPEENKILTGCSVWTSQERREQSWRWQRIEKLEPQISKDNVYKKVGRARISTKIQVTYLLCCIEVVFAQQSMIQLPSQSWQRPWSITTLTHRSKSCECWCEHSQQAVYKIAFSVSRLWVETATIIDNNTHTWIKKLRVRVCTQSTSCL